MLCWPKINKGSSHTTHGKIVSAAAFWYFLPNSTTGPGNKKCLSEGKGSTVNENSWMGQNGRRKLFQIISFVNASKFHCVCLKKLTHDNYPILKLLDPFKFHRGMKVLRKLVGTLPERDIRPCRLTLEDLNSFSWFLSRRDKDDDCWGVKMT